jgi:hypothetical protein
MRTIHRNAIVELGSHMKRISTSLSLMDLTHPAHPTEQVGEALTSFMNEASLEEKLVPMLRQGLEAYYAQVDPTSNTVHPSEAKVSLVVAYSFEVKTGISLRFSFFFFLSSKYSL